MAHVSLQGVEKTFTGKLGVRAIENLDLDIPEGQLLVLLGPSGCGKTTILRSIAGLETPDRGTIRLGGTTVFDGASRTSVAPQKRDIGMVFQSYALWPHMTVRQNIAYPLQAKGRRELLRGGAVERVAELVEVAPLLDRFPSQLSGGQQQRVALARGLVAEPAVLLLDEPLSNLDARLRHELRVEIRHLHQTTGFTGVYVTHDQVEAFSVADLVVVMGAGRVLQRGTPEEVYSKPRSLEVARFLGINNAVSAHADAALWKLPDGSSMRPVAGYEELRGPLELRFRADALEVASGAVSPSADLVPVGDLTVDAVVYAGQFWDIAMSTAGVSYIGRRASSAAGKLPGAGDTVQGVVSRSALLVYRDGVLVEPR